MFFLLSLPNNFLRDLFCFCFYMFAGQVFIDNSLTFSSQKKTFDWKSILCGGGEDHHQEKRVGTSVVDDDGSRGIFLLVFG